MTRALASGSHNNSHGMYGIFLTHVGIRSWEDRTALARRYQAPPFHSSFLESTSLPFHCSASCQDVEHTAKDSITSTLNDLRSTNGSSRRDWFVYRLCLNQ